MKPRPSSYRPPRGSWVVVLCVAVVLQLNAGCEPAVPQRPPPNDQSQARREYPGKLLPPAALALDFQWRQKVTAHWKTGTRSFDAVLAKSDGELQLLGLNPMGMPGFVLRLTASGVEFENRTDQELPFEPRVILLDVQRVFYPWFDEPGPVQGQRQREVNDEAISERWAGGKIVERRFRRTDDAALGEIVVRYEGWEADADAPSRAVLDNGWFGYSLEVETLDQQRL